MAHKKESVVGSITTIEPAKLKVSTSRSLSNNLAGTVAGVLAVQRSGNRDMIIQLFGFVVLVPFKKLVVIH